MKLLKIQRSKNNKLVTGYWVFGKPSDNYVLDGNRLTKNELYFNSQK